MAAVKKTGLPKGISWREDRKQYLGRVTYKRQKYLFYDKDWRRLERRLNELRVELDKGQYVKESTLTLDAWFEKWMVMYKKNTVKAGTYENYKNYYQYYVQKKIGKKKMCDVTVDDIQSIYNWMNDNGYKKSTVKVVGAALGGCFKKAYQNRMIVFNPVPVAEIPSCEERIPKHVFSKEEQRDFVEEIRGSYLMNFFLVILMTGMRNGEARALRWQDVDFGVRLLHIRHTLRWDSKKRCYVLDKPKTKTSKRDIPMLKQVEDILREMKKRADEMGIGGDDNYVFCLPDGSEISRFRVANELKRIESDMMEKGLIHDHFTCHTLRHAFATRMIEGGIKPHVLKAVMGHSNISMTMDLYVHVLGEEKTQEMFRLGDIFDICRTDIEMGTGTC